MKQNEPSQALRTVSATLYVADGSSLLPAVTTWLPGMAKVRKAGGAFEDAVNLPVAVAGAGDGFFDFVLAISEVDTVGPVRVAFFDAPNGELLGEYIDTVTEAAAADLPYAPSPGDITWDMVVDFDASTADTPLAAQAIILAYINHEALDPGVFGGEGTYKYKLARIYLAAHHGYLALPSSGDGDIASKTISADSMTVSFQAASSDASDLSSTVGGSAYLEILSSAGGARIFPMQVSTRR